MGIASCFRQCLPCINTYNSPKVNDCEDNARLVHPVGQQESDPMYFRPFTYRRFGTRPSTEKRDATAIRSSAIQEIEKLVLEEKLTPQKILYSIFNQKTNNNDKYKNIILAFQTKHWWSRHSRSGSFILTYFAILHNHNCLKNDKIERNQTKNVIKSFFIGTVLLKESVFKKIHFNSSNNEPTIEFQNEKINSKFPEIKQQQICYEKDKKRKEIFEAFHLFIKDIFINNLEMNTISKKDNKIIRIKEFLSIYTFSDKMFIITNSDIENLWTHAYNIAKIDDDYTQKYIFPILQTLEAKPILNDFIKRQNTEAKNQIIELKYKLNDILEKFSDWEIKNKKPKPQKELINMLKDCKKSSAMYASELD